MGHAKRLSAAGLLIALGIIYGDIGTSPLYVLNAIVKNKIVADDLVIGALSLTIWTLTLQTTIKYVILTLQADNKGDGGLCSLPALVRRRKKWLAIHLSEEKNFGLDTSNVIVEKFPLFVASVANLKLQRVNH